MTRDFEIAESARYGAALTVGPAASYHHHSGRYQIQLSGHGFEASNFLSEDDLRELRDWINEELGEQSLREQVLSIADDFHPTNEREAPLALQEMREALSRAVEAKS